MTLKTTAYRAALVIPINREPIIDGVVTIANQFESGFQSETTHSNFGQIVSVEHWAAKKNPPERVVDLGSVALIPGLVNAHTHLEFSHLQRPLLKRGCSFTDWIRAVVGLRRELASAGNDSATAIAGGLRESATAGVACLGEIASSVPETADINASFAVDSCDHSPNSKIAAADRQSRERNPFFAPTVITFLEQLGRDEAQFAAKLDQTTRFIQSFAEARSNPISAVDGLPAISPHSPYSVHPQLLESLCRLAIQTQIPVAMHVAETREERELLDHQTGPFVDLLKDFGVWNPATFQPTQSILNVLETLSQTPHALVIHGNYLTDAELEFIAQHRDRMSIVYCPRTHDYFGHDRYPLESIRRLDVNVAVGTDSRASNPDLDLWADLQMIAEKFPSVSALEILKMGTLNGAKALAVENQFGSISPGKIASLIAIDLPHDRANATTDLEWLFSQQTKRFNLSTK